jgi:hypothetical protein
MKKFGLGEVFSCAGWHGVENVRGYHRVKIVAVKAVRVLQAVGVPVLQRDHRFDEARVLTGLNATRVLFAKVPVEQRVLRGHLLIAPPLLW